MRSILLTIIALLIAVPCYAGGALMVGGGGAATGGSCIGSSPVCLFRESFNGISSCGGGGGAGYSNCDNYWTWIEGVPNTSAAPLPGVYALLQGTGTSSDGFAPQNDVYATIIFHVTNYTQNASLDVSIQDGSGNKLCRVRNWQSGIYTTSLGGTNSLDIVSNLANNTTTYIKLRAISGTGNNAVCRGWVSSDGITWGTPQASSNGTWTASSSVVAVTSPSEGGIKVNDIRVDGADISY